MNKENRKFLMISWIIIPLLLVWLSTGYIMGLTKPPTWVGSKENTISQEVLGTEIAIKDKEVTKLHWSNRGLITFWFDDAWSSQFTVAFPLLQEKNLVGAIAVPTGMIGYADYMSWNQLKTLQRNGWEITSHTMHHECDPNVLTPKYIEDELKGSLQVLNSHGLRAIHFVTPCGVKQDQITSIAKEYYLSLRTTDEGFNTLPVVDSYSLKIQSVEWKTTAEDVQKWIKEAEDNKYWLILMFHQIQQNESKFATTPDLLKKIVTMTTSSNLETVVPTQATQLIIDNSVFESSNIKESSQDASPIIGSKNL